MSINLRKRKIYLFVIVAIILLTIIAFIFRSSIQPIKDGTSNDNNIVSETPVDFLKIVDCYKQTESKPCLDKFISDYASKVESVKEILNAMEVSRTVEPLVESQCHDISHAIGRYTFKKYSNIGDAFDACDQSCLSGCYHGVMERMFYTDAELDSEGHLTYNSIKDKIPGICDRNKFTNPNPTSIFQCLHGVGHAVMFSLDYDLDTALKACDLLTTQYEQVSCYGGVFMENITAFDKKKRDLKFDDYLYPCNRVASQYQPSCFEMQTSAMFEFGLTGEEIVEQCAISEHPAVCDQSLGRDLSNNVRNGTAQYAADICESIPNGFSKNCINGVIYTLVDDKWSGESAFGFCTILKDSDNKAHCYRAASNYLMSIYKKSREFMEDNCDQYAENEINICKENILFL